MNYVFQNNNKKYEKYWKLRISKFANHFALLTFDFVFHFA